VLEMALERLQFAAVLQADQVLIVD
jgi:hypothetical protein